MTPTDPLPVVCYDAKVGERSFRRPALWSRALLGCSNINAKAEGIESERAFREEVSGTIAGYARIMTTAIVVKTSEGDLGLALGLGCILIGISIAVSASAFMFLG